MSKTSQAATHGIQSCEYIYMNSARRRLTNEAIKGENIGRLSRPYMRSPLIIKEIISTKEGIPDATAKGALNYRAPGTFADMQILKRVRTH